MNRTAKQYPRFAREAVLELTASHGENLCSGRSRHISTVGFSVYVDAEVVPGTNVNVRMSLVFEKDTFSEPLTIPARVVWCTSIAGQYQIGSAFLPIDQETKYYLAMFLRYLDSEDDDDPDDHGSNRDAPGRNIDSRFTG